MKRLWIILLLCASLAGCSKERSGGAVGNGDPGQQEETGGTPINPGAMVKGPAFSDEVDDTPQVSLSNIKVLRVDGITPNFTLLTAPAISATITAGSTAMPFSPRQYFKANHDDAHFMAYYPAGTFVAGNPVKVNYTIDGSQDIMATAPSTAVWQSGGTNIAFQFEHKLALLELNVIAADQGTATAYGALQHASVSAPNELTLSISAAGSSSLARSAGSSAMADMVFTGAQMSVSPEKKSYYVMVDPASVITKIKLTFANRTATLLDLYETGTNTLGLSLEAGKKTVITAMVYADEIQCVVSIEPWKVDATNPGGEIEVGGNVP